MEPAKVADPLTELLAIKLYEHDAGTGKWPLQPGFVVANWMHLPDEIRQLYRDVASGVTPLGG